MEMVQFNNEIKYNEDNFSTGKVKFDFSSLINKEIKLDPKNYSSSAVTDDSKPRKKKANINGTEIVTREDDLPMTQTNTPYRDTYAETDAILKTAIIQLDNATMQLTEDINEIRSSKTLRKKYDYLAAMHGSLGNLIGNKISAARELNNSIRTAHELELKRAKEFNLNQQVDDTKAIMDMYTAFVSTPVSVNPVNYSTPIGPNTVDLTLLGSNVLASAIGSNPDAGYMNYLQNLTPEQAMMLYESNPDIKQVVVYNKDTHEKHFEIMNMKTGEILHGLPKRNDAMYMPDTVIDLNNRVARNVNLDETYDVVIVGNDMAKY